MQSTTNPSQRWLAGLTAGAAGIGAMTGLDEAYGAIVSLDNGGGGWTVNAPVATGSTNSTVADIGGAGGAAFKMSWWSNSFGNNENVFGQGGAQVGNAFQRNVASATPGTTGFAGALLMRAGSAVYIGPGIYSYGSNNSRTGNNNWLAVKFTDSGINGGATTYGWAQFNFSAAADTLMKVVYSNSGATVELDGAGGYQEAGTSVPVPGTLALLAAGAGGIGAFRRRRAAARQAH
jgi:hypothetical protein